MPLEIAKIKAICFDVDGTLRDTDDQYVGRLSRFLAPLRFLLPNKDPEPLARFLVMRLEGPVNALFALADALGLDKALQKMVELFGSRNTSGQESAYKMVPGIFPIIEKLSKKYPLAIVTSRGKTGTLAFLKESQLLKYFGPIASAFTTQRGKPKADPIIWAAKEMGLPPQDCLMVGDTVMDIRSGKAAGAQTIGVLSGFGEKEELIENGADQILLSVAELQDLLAG